MVIPWVGYSLSELIKKVEPLGNAKYVEFITLADPKTMPFVGSRVLDWPYVEALRMDEAMHPLALLAFGMYGEVLPNQNGAPVRMVVPWKYGFKSGKWIVKIRFIDKEPGTAWNKAAAQEYGFYSNVNPNVDHPRWSQATERRIGDGGGCSPSAQDPDVQRLRGPGRPALRRHGPQEELLKALRDSPRNRAAVLLCPQLIESPMNKLLLHPAAKPVVFVLCLLPFAWLFYGALTNGLGANPAEYLIRATGDWTPALHLHRAGRDAAARHRRPRRWRVSRACWACSRTSTWWCTC